MRLTDGNCKTARRFETPGPEGQTSPTVTAPAETNHSCGSPMASPIPSAEATTQNTFLAGTTPLSISGNAQIPASRMVSSCGDHFGTPSVSSSSSIGRHGDKFNTSRNKMPASSLVMWPPRELARLPCDDRSNSPPTTGVGGCLGWQGFRVLQPHRPYLRASYPCASCTATAARRCSNRRTRCPALASRSRRCQHRPT